MTIGSGMVVANNYYNQPLLGKIANTFQVTEAKAGTISVLTQIGYAIGLLFIIPLGDIFNRVALVGLVGSSLAMAVHLLFSRQNKS